jgi:hypothetical protein
MNRGPPNIGKQKPKGTKIKGITYYMGNTNKGATSKGIKRVITGGWARVRGGGTPFRGSIPWYDFSLPKAVSFCRPTFS